MKKIVVVATWVALAGAGALSARGADRTWVGGDNAWFDGIGGAFWSPAVEPGPGDSAIFNTSNAVNLGSNNHINGLTMSGGIDLSTNGANLTVDGLTQLTGASTNLFIGGAGSNLTTYNLTVGGSAAVELTGGALHVVDPSLVLAGSIAIRRRPCSAG